MINKTIKKLFLTIIFIFIFQLSSLATPIPNKNLGDQDGWVLTMILDDSYKIEDGSGVVKSRASKIHEIEQYVLPENSQIGQLIFDEESMIPPLAEIISNGKVVGYLFETYDWVKGLGYSRKPYHIVAGINLEGNITGVRIMWHTEPIAILGRTDQDLHDFVEQLGGVSIKQGINIVLGLSDSVLEGESISMRGTAGDTSGLYQVDGISRTTTTSLLLNDAVMRAARKVARTQNILLNDKDLGLILNLENYEELNWEQLLEKGSVSKLGITNIEINDKFEIIEDIKAPRKVRLGKDEAIWTTIYSAIVNPEGIGANILGRRWYDQYVIAGRNVEDLVIWIAFEGPGSFYDKAANLDKDLPYQTLAINQNGETFELTPNMYKSLPFHHAPGAPKMFEQGLFYFSKDSKLDPTTAFEFEYFIKGDVDESMTKGNSVNFTSAYEIPSEYINLDYEGPLPLDDVTALEGFDWKSTWLLKKNLVVMSILTVFGAILILIFKDFLTRRRKLHTFIRISFLAWILVWLGWMAGGQVSIIHLAAFVQGLIDRQGFSSFLAAPAIVIIGLSALISAPIWGRALFCGWLCPFGALQELLNKFSIYIGIKQLKISDNLDKNLKFGKYIVLLGLVGIFLYSFDLGLTASAIEPFKTAITFRFNAPFFAVCWVLVLLTAGLFIERAYCRFMCPLGAAAAIIGKVRIFNFLHRHNECGNPCKACVPVCPTKAVKKDGNIDMNECFQCLDCQVMFFDKKLCPPLVAKSKKA